MKVIFTGAGPGDPDLLTVKGRKILESASICIYAGSLVSPEVVSLCPDGADLYDSAAMSLEDIIGVIVKAQETDTDVIRLHTGDPSIYGAINEQMDELDKLGIDYEVVPGVSSFQSAAAVLKSELTHPEVSQTVVITRTSGRTPLPEQQELVKLAESRATLCIFLSIHKIGQIARELIPFYGEDCPAGVVYRASWPDQEVVRGTLKDVAEKVDEKGFTKTAMIVVGHALGRGDQRSKLYDKSFTHEYRKGK